MNQIELGLDTFGDVTLAADGTPKSLAQVIRDVVEEAVIADQVGCDFIGLGEHHRPDFAVTTPEMVLATIAGRTSRIKLGSAVTVLSSDDPVRVFQRFSTLDATSNGRAEVILGRGSFIESFPLFGFPLDQYERLFEEKLDLFVKLLEADRTRSAITWRGSTRAPLEEQRALPYTDSGALKAWIGVGGSPESVVRAAHHGIPLMLAIIGGNPRRFAPFIELYREQLAARGKAMLPVGIHSHGYVSETDESARTELWPHYKAMRDRIGRERGWPPTSREDFEREIQHGSLYAGSPETVAQRIASTVRDMGVQRFDIKYSAGTLSHEQCVTCIELYGTRVIPRVRELLAE